MSNNNTDNISEIKEIKVQVALRIRPLSAEELVRIPSRLQRNVISTTPFTPNQVVIQGEKKQSFTFDHVFGPETTQKEIYDKTVMKLIDQFLEGNNVTVLTFGHTSSGKSYTMGTTEKSTHESKGIIPRSITTLLSCVNSTQYKTRKPFMKVSFVEIYNDESTDLLCEGGDRKLNTSLTGLQEIRVNSAEEVTGLLSLGQLNRRSNAQDLNRHDPDNSHVIVTFTLTQQKFIPNNGPSTGSSDTPPSTPSTPNKVFSPKLNKQFDGEWVTVTSKFHFVDLAGNEMEKGSFGLEHKLKEHFTSTNELTTKVAIGNAICALGDPSENSTFLPYKGSKLTRILQNYLCNNIQALIIACVSPIEYNIKETVNTLEYAKHARKIKYTHINHQEDQVEEKEEEEGWNNLEHLQNLVLKLRSEIKALKGALTFSFDNDLESGTISNDQSSLSSSNNEKEINSLENKFIILKRSFNDLSKEFVKSKTSDSITEENIDDSNSEEDADNVTLVQDDNSSTHSKDESRSKQNNDKSFIKNVWPSFQKAVGPLIQEYEKSISSLENQLSLVRAALTHSESKMQVQERKLNEAEESNEHSKTKIDDLKHKISKLHEREETTENYIKDLEAKLNSDSNEIKKDKLIINDLKNYVEKLSGNEQSAESFIRDLESRIEENENKNLEMSRLDSQLEKELQIKEEKYLALVEQFKKQKNVDKEENKWLLGEIRVRDNKILRLEKNVENLINEIENMKKLKIEVTSHSRNNHSKSSSISSIMDTPSFLRPNKIREFPSVTPVSPISVFDQFDDIQIMHEKTLTELDEVKNKYEKSLAELNELRSKLSDTQLERKAKITTSSMIQNLQVESNKLENVHADKDSDLDSIKNEFNNLKTNYSETLEIVENLREEIKRRDTLAQLEVMSGKETEFSYESSSVAANEQQDELVQRLREEVKRHKDKQRKLLEILAEKEKIPNIHLITIIEKHISGLKYELNQDVNNETIRDLQIIITALEDQLIKFQKSSIESSKDEISESVQTEQNMISELQNLVDKIQKEMIVKSHIIASLLFPSVNYEDSIQKLENELEETKQEFRRRSQESIRFSGVKIGENTSDRLVQNSNDQLKELEDKVKSLEDQLSKAKLAQQDTIIQIPLSDLSQKSIKEFQEKLDYLQKELFNKSETIENLQVERDIVMMLQEQLKNLKTEITNKHELIESIKKDLTNDVTLEKKLRQKEAQTLSLKMNLFQVQKQEEALQKELSELRKSLENGEADQVRQSELDRLRKELKIAHEREIMALERIRVLKARLGNDSEESQLQEQLDYSHYVEIIQKNKILELENRISEKGTRVDEYLIQLKSDLAITKESMTSHIKIIETLETKLKNVEHSSQLFILEQQIQDLKLKESEQLQKIQSLEIQLNDQNFNDFDQIKHSLEEVKKVIEQEQNPEYEFDTITNSLEEFKEDSLINSIKNEVDELKYSKTDLCKKVQELQTQLIISEEKLLIVEGLQEEILHLKNLNNEQKISIQQLHLQLNQMRDSKESTVKELMTLKENFNLQKEVVKFLEDEMKNMKEELVVAHETHTSLTQEYEKVSSLLNTTQKQCANEKKQKETLEIEVETFKLAGNSGDKNVNSLREALTKTKLEMVAQNEILNELESEMMNIEKDRDHHVKLSKELTATLEENESKHQETVKELKSKMLILEEELALAKESSKLNGDIITNHKEKLFDIQTQLENTNNSDKDQSKIIKEMEVKLNKANSSLSRREDKLMKQNLQINELEAAIEKSNLELQKAITSKAEAEKRIKELESKIAETEIELVKETNESQSTRVKELEGLLSKAQQNENHENNTAELIAELEKAKEAEAIRIKFIKELETKLEEKNNYVDELEEAVELSNAELMKLQESENKHIELVNKLENKLKNIQKVKEIPNTSREIKPLKVSQKSSNTFFDAQDSGTKKFAIDEINNSNELLKKNNDSLIAEIIELEARATILTKESENLHDEISKHNSYDADSLMEMKVKIKELQTVKDELENKNENYFEKCSKLEEKVQSLMKQLWALGNDGNTMALQVTDLNSQIMDREKEITSLKQKSTTGHKEISRLSKENESLKEKIKNLSAQASRGINDALVRNLSKETNSDKDENLIPKLLQHESKIKKQNDLIKNLQEHISELEQLLDESCRDIEGVNNANNNQLSTEIQKLNKKIMSKEGENLKNKQFIKNLETKFKENESHLQKTKEELNEVLNQKQELSKYVSELKSILDDARTEIENTKSSVENQKVHMEKALEEERKAKEKSEKARLALESRVERLMAKKNNKFMCF
ncbi:uncharacterized protein OCT59_010472 [Rhizophagus irregularis]|uniref:Kip1p n=1 Tax=Rhizophagus irregularis (strain DAOM 197198w) TaxID=1432141 RepID=A0A015LEM1_RHIIW|nr:Kip1p [Rhizophagus irregularis DAOM 197198w]UZO19172.1 hypothetical protein OCT59_010472 [Rhizophagus irregularis]GBC29969.1 P-loop containing nucleoside triphosphate hydrolase protein [Rhizophagus irregularis DAOM 181602=DAOM 197198]